MKVTNSKLYFLLLIQCFICRGQSINEWILNKPINAENQKYYKYDINEIKNTESMIFLLDKLFEIKNHSVKDRINFVHIGDSHIQADIMTNIIRTEFQSFYGNAGRGLVFPYQIANTNAPFDIISESKNLWKTNKITIKETADKSGLLGFSIQTTDINPGILISLNQKYTLNNEFDKISIFTSNTISKINLEYNNYKDSLNFEKTNIKNNYTLNQNSNSIKLEFKTLTDSIFNFYGLFLEKSKSSGIFYNSIGVNGAKYSNYNQSKQLWNQLEAVKPDCFILSMGTNEAQDLNLEMSDFKLTLTETLVNIKKTNPTASIILFTPPVSYFKKKRPNNKLVEISNTIIKFCIDNNIAYWDLFNICNGQKGAEIWKKAQLLRTDLVHFCKPAYEMQGQMFAEAFTKLWNNYLKLKN